MAGVGGDAQAGAADVDLARDDGDADLVELDVGVEADFERVDDACADERFGVLAGPENCNEEDAEDDAGGDACDGKGAGEFGVSIGCHNRAGAKIVPSVRRILSAHDLAAIRGCENGRNATTFWRG